MDIGIASIAALFNRWLRPVLDIAILAWLIYRGYKLLMKTQAVQLAKGAAWLGIVYAVAFLLGLSTLSWVLGLLAPGLVIALAIVFQPELRKMFIRLGQSGLFRKGKRTGSSQVDAVLHAAEILAEKRRGALIIFARSVNLDDIVERGTRLDAELSTALLLSIFEYDTPLHDGAVIIKEGRVVSAGCFLPLSQQQDIMKSFGTRHRSALGISEESDAVVLVVSEESGAISLVYDSRLFYDLDPETVNRRLSQLLDYSNEKEDADEE